MARKGETVSEEEQRYRALASVADANHLSELQELSAMGVLLQPGEGYKLAMDQEGNSAQQLADCFQADASFRQLLERYGGSLSPAGLVTQLAILEANLSELDLGISPYVIEMVSRLSIVMAPTLPRV